MKEFSFNLSGWDIGVQFCDLGDKDYYHIHLSILDPEQDNKEYVFCGDAPKEKLDKIWKLLHELRLSAIYYLDEETGREF